jgi:CBS domain-containing protein
MARRIFQIIPCEEVAVLAPSATVYTAAATMKERRQCVVLVMTAGDLNGILTEQDIVRRLVAERRDCDTVTVGEIMTCHPDTINQDALALNGLQMMEDGNYRHLPVIHKGRVVSMISRLDFLGEEKAELETQRRLQERLW